MRLFRAILSLVSRSRSLYGRRCTCSRSCWPNWLVSNFFRENTGVIFASETLHYIQESRVLPWCLYLLSRVSSTWSWKHIKEWSIVSKVAWDSGHKVALSAPLGKGGARSATLCQESQATLIVSSANFYVLSKISNFFRVSLGFAQVTGYQSLLLSYGTQKRVSL